MINKKLRFVFFLATLVTTARADLVYDNSTGDLSTRFNPGTNEVGDEVILAGSSRIVTNFVFQYYGISGNGNESAQVRFYANNGPPSLSGFPAPGTLLWDSLPFNVTATPRNTLIFNRSQFFGGAGVTVPNSFTWSVQFFNIQPGEDFGVDLYDPPAVGNNPRDYWDKSGGTWTLRTNATTAINFAARIEAVPEPGVATIAIAGAIMGLAACWRLKKK